MMSYMTATRAPRDSEIRDIAMAIQAVVWSLRRFGERRVGLDPLPQSEFEVLRMVADKPGISVSEVARALALQPSNVSTTVRRLSERGLVTRSSDAKDRRSIRLQLTELALEHKALMDDAWARAIADRLSAMSREDAQLLVRAAPLIHQLAGMG